MLASPEIASPDLRVSPLTPLKGWGQLPLFTLISSFGLLLIGIANNLGRSGSSIAITFFWVGLLVILLPVVFRLLSPKLTRKEALGLSIVVGMSLYAVKMLYSPLMYNFGDELQHWRTLLDILVTGDLFNKNPILPVSPFYPGLENITSAIVNVSGIDPFLAGVLTIGLARILIALSLFLFYEFLLGQNSYRTAAVGALLYFTNPLFMYFGGQYGYESLALPLAAFTLYTVAKRIYSDSDQKLLLTITWILSVTSVVVTHHLSSYALLAFLATFAVAALMGHRISKKTIRSVWPVAILAALCAFWIRNVANLTVGYLGSNVTNAFYELIKLISGEAVSRQLFKSATGESPPIIDQLMGYGSTALVFGGLCLGLVLIWMQFRNKPFIIAMALVGFAYFGTFPLRLTSAGGNIAGRLPEYLFIGISFVIAIWLIDLGTWKFFLIRRFYPLLVIGYVGVLFWGGVVVGWSPPGKVAGPYRPSAHGRSMDAEGVEVAYWTRDFMGTGNRLGTDWANGHLIGAFGLQHILSLSNDGLAFYWLFYGTNFSEDDMAIIRRGEIDYLAIDFRNSSALPQTGFYYDPNEQDSGKYQAPIYKPALTKFDMLPSTNRIYDSGNIVIYDLRDEADAR